MTTRRITIETLRSGQPRPYADTEHHVRVTFETSWSRGQPLKPQFIGEAHVREFLPHLRCGFVTLLRKDKGPGQDDYYKTHLDWLRPVDAEAAAAQNLVGASVWEFHTTTPFTD